MSERKIIHERQIISDLLSEMRAFCERCDLDLKTLSKRATGNAEFYERLAKGGDCTTGTVVKVRNHMAANAPIEDAA